MTQLINQQEWNQLYNMIYGYFYRRINIRADVDELACETVTDYCLTEHEIENPKAFIFAIARNKLYKFIDQKNKRKFISLDEQEENLTYAHIEDHYSDSYLAKIEDLKNCIKRQLKPQDQEIIELSIMCDFSSERVAKELNLQAPNVRQRLSRAIKKLRGKCRQIWLQTT